MAELLLEYNRVEYLNCDLTTAQGLAESTRGPQVDRAQSRLRGVKLLGLQSTNGRSYPAATLLAALPLYEGAKVNVNHPAAGPNAIRDYEDRIGSISDVRFIESQGLFGDFCFNPMHPLAEQLLWDAEHAPQNVGFSHNVMAVISKHGDASIVDQIVAVQSVDLVADPATTRGLFEASAVEVIQAKPAEATLPEAENLEETRDIALQIELHESQNQLAQGLCQIAQLQNQLVTAQQAMQLLQRQAKVRVLLCEAGLWHALVPGDRAAGAVDQTLWEQLLASEQERVQRRLISERKRVLEAWQRETRSHDDRKQSLNLSPLSLSPQSREQALVERSRESGSQNVDAVRDFTKAIRR